MSDINYAVYGDPTQWTHWQNATPQSGTQGTLWGQQRIGASVWTDSDFDDYPYFMFGKDTIYRNYKNIGSIDINTPIDSSIAYSAMANPELPQQNTVVLDRFHSTLSDPVAYTEKTTPTPFALSWYYYGTGHIMNPAQRGDIYGLDGFPDNASVFGAQGMQRISPYALWDSTFTNTWGMYNPNLRIAPVVSFGIKSVILEIIVTYDTNGGYYPAEKSSLKTYLAHSESWLQSHKLIAACCIPYYRTNKNGTYTSTNAAPATDRFGGCSTLFFRPYKLQGIDIYNYTAYLSSDLNISGNLPIYGNPIADGSYTAKDTYGYYNYNNPTQTDMNSYAVLFGTNRGDLVKTVSSGSVACHMELDMSITENVEYIMRGAAAYGLFFCTEIGTLGVANRDSGAAERWIDDDMYLGIIAADGCTYGDYTHGADNADQQQYGWKSSTETPYVPGSGSDPNSYSNQTKFNIISPTVQMTKQYVLNAVNVAKLATDLWSITATLSSSQTDFTDFEGKVKDEFLTNDPLECIVSLRRFPFDIEHEASSVNVKLGKTAGSAVGYQNKYSSAEFSFRPVQIYPRFGNSFLDYAPYTEYELYVPFCGVTKIDAADILGHTLNVKMIADLTTGSCTAFVMADDLVIQSLSGSVAVEIPVTGTDAATINSQIMNGILNNERAQNQAKTALASIFTPSGFVKNIASFGMSSAKENIAAAENVKKADYDLTHINAPVHTIGSASALEKWYIDLQCRLLIYYPEGDAVTSAIPPDLNSDVIAKYGATTGFSTVEEGKIEDYTGLTVAVNPVLSNIVTGTLYVPASSRELEMIEEALSEGVIV